MHLDTFTKELVEKLSGVRRQAQYKRQLALALAASVHPPPGHMSLLYGNKLHGLFDSTRAAWKHDNHEVMVDLVLMHRRASSEPWQIEVAAESEAFADHNVTLAGDDDTEDCGYYWDFWKLLHFRAPTRVFLAVTSPSTGSTLRSNLMAYAEKYSAVIAPKDRLILVTIKNQDQPGWLHIDSAVHDGTKLNWSPQNEHWMPTPG